MKPDELYYYADGKRIDLTPRDEVVAVRQGSVVEPGRLEARARKKVTAGLRTLMQGWALANTSSLTATSRAALEADGSLQRVFEATGAQLVALPEVRIEETRATHKRKLQNWLAKIAEAEVQSIDDDGEITILRPRSGRGEDAIRLASRIFEEAHPEAATPRFIRIVARPRTELRKPGTVY